MPDDEEFIEVMKCKTSDKRDIITGETIFIASFENELKTVKLKITTDEKKFYAGDEKELVLSAYLPEDDDEGIEEQVEPATNELDEA